MEVLITLLHADDILPIVELAFICTYSDESLELFD